MSTTPRTPRHVAGARIEDWPRSGLPHYDSLSSPDTVLLPAVSVSPVLVRSISSRSLGVQFNTVHRAASVRTLTSRGCLSGSVAINADIDDEVKLKPVLASKRRRNSAPVQISRSAATCRSLHRICTRSCLPPTVAAAIASSTTTPRTVSPMDNHIDTHVPGVSAELADTRDVTSQVARLIRAMLGVTFIFGHTCARSRCCRGAGRKRRRGAE